jgi:hypothetical protein
MTAADDGHAEKPPRQGGAENLSLKRSKASLTPS